MPHPQASRELLVLRHAKSAWNTQVAGDFERPLNARGHQEAPRIGRWLKAQGYRPDRIRCSPAVRAAQTLDHVSQAGGFAQTPIDWVSAIYEASLDTLLKVVADTPAEADRVLLVGHNPGLEALLMHLSGNRLPSTAEGKSLPTATLVRLAMPGDWQVNRPGSATVLDWVRARDLSATDASTMY